MNRVCIVTNYCDTGNYGALLQAYALNQVVTSMTGACETLNYSRARFGKSKLRRYLDDLKAGHIQKVLKDFNRDVRKLFVRRKIVARKRALDAFRDAIPHTSSFREHDVAQIEGEYQTLLCGSDQIWRPDFQGQLIGTYWLGCFSDAVVKASYAASMGIDRFPSTTESLAREYLTRLDKISVREEQAQVYLSKLSGRRDIVTLIDPVFLLAADEWARLAETDDGRDDYILVYEIQGGARFQRGITEFARKNRLKIVTFPYMSYYYRGYERCFGDERNFEATPYQFIGLLRGAKCVFTDSFHATAFSIIFHKKFYVSTANTKAVSRIENLTNRLSVGGCVVPPEGLRADLYSLTCEVDWAEVDVRIEEERKRGLDYLDEVLQMSAARCEGMGLRT
jgi:hypothetical protein